MAFIVDVVPKELRKLQKKFQKEIVRPRKVEKGIQEDPIKSKFQID